MRRFVPLLLSACTAAGSGPPADTDAPPAMGCADAPVGGDEGDCAPTFQVRDASGAVVADEELLVRDVVLDFSTMWCSTCRNAADDGQALHERFGDEVTIATVLYEDNDGDDPDADDLAEWTEAFELTHPVYADEGEAARSVFGGRERPLFLLIDADGVIRFRGGAGRLDELEALVEARVGEG